CAADLGLTDGRVQSSHPTKQGRIRTVALVLASAVAVTIVVLMRVDEVSSAVSNPEIAAAADHAPAPRGAGASSSMSAAGLAAPAVHMGGESRSAGAAGQAGAADRTAADPDRQGALRPSFDDRWHDGRAEVNGYRLTVDRYGHPRPGRGVAIYVTE